jgi:hypothetical protein
MLKHMLCKPTLAKPHSHPTQAPTSMHTWIDRAGAEKEKGTGISAGNQEGTDPEVQHQAEHHQQVMVHCQDLPLYLNPPVRTGPNSGKHLRVPNSAGLAPNPTEDQPSTTQQSQTLPSQHLRWKLSRISQSKPGRSSDRVRGPSSQRRHMPESSQLAA